jgi:Do/DeqQ family serine protease
MKKFASLVLVSAIGGMLTLGTYLFFFQEKEPISEQKTTPKSDVFLTNNTTSSIPESTLDFTKAAKETVDAVVHVKNTSVQTVHDPFAEFFYGRSSSRKYSQVGTGSGVIISKDGYIITNNHVIKGASEIEITLNNKKTYTAELIGTDSESDIALLKIDADEDLPYLIFGNSDNIQVGEWVLAVGNPFNLTSTVTAGIISAKGRDLEGNDVKESFIQTDAAVNPGNSGGALVNTRGELMGINTAITSRTGSFIGYSFAVPSNIARKVIEDLLEYGNVQHAVLGVNGEALNAHTAKTLDLEIAEGFFIGHVVTDSGAEKAGIKNHDIIIEIDAVKIKTFSDLSGYLNSKQPGDEVKVTVLRGEEQKVFNVILDKESGIKKVGIGISVIDLTRDELKEKGLSNGVKIIDIENKTLLEYNVKKGFIITKINGVKVTTASQVERIINSKLEREIIRIEMVNLKGVTERYIFR